MWEIEIQPGRPPLCGLHKLCEICAVPKWPLATLTSSMACLERTYMGHPAYSQALGLPDTNSLPTLRYAWICASDCISRSIALAACTPALLMDRSFAPASNQGLSRSFQEASVRVYLT